MVYLDAIGIGSVASVAALPYKISVLFHFFYYTFGREGSLTQHSTQINTNKSGGATHHNPVQKPTRRTYKSVHGSNTKQSPTPQKKDEQRQRQLYNNVDFTLECQLCITSKSI